MKNRNLFTKLFSVTSEYNKYNNIRTTIDIVDASEMLKIISETKKIEPDNTRMQIANSNLSSFEIYQCSASDLSTNIVAVFHRISSNHVCIKSIKHVCVSVWVCVAV